MRVKIIHTETSSEVSCTVGHTILTWEVQRVLTGGEITRQRRRISRGTEENLEESLLKRSHGKVRTAVPHRRRTQDHRPGAWFSGVQVILFHNIMVKDWKQGLSNKINLSKGGKVLLDQFRFDFLPCCGGNVRVYVWDVTAAFQESSPMSELCTSGASWSIPDLCFHWRRPQELTTTI